MYISKIRFNLMKDFDNNVGRLLNDVCEMHKFVWSFFKDMNDIGVSRSNINLLYRVIEKDDAVFVTMQSDVKPSLENIPIYVEPIYSVDDTVMISKLKKYSKLRYNILVNPVRKDSDGKRKYINSDEDKKSWFKYNLKDSGVSILSVDVKNSDFETGMRQNKKVSFGVSELVGVLQITDFEKFYEKICKGVGHEKAYGLGMFLFGV